MSKKIIKISTIILFIVIMALIMIYAMGITLGGRSRIYIDDYKEFYLYKADISTSFMAFPGIHTKRYRIWCLPQQKQKLLDKIIDDTNKELSDLAEEYNDIIEAFEISDDFKKVYIFCHRDSKHSNRFASLHETLTEKVEYRVELYFQILNGYGNTNYDGNILNYVE